MKHPYVFSSTHSWQIADEISVCIKYFPSVYIFYFDIYCARQHVRCAAVVVGAVYPSFKWNFRHTAYISACNMGLHIRVERFLSAIGPIAPVWIFPKHCDALNSNMCRKNRQKGGLSWGDLRVFEGAIFKAKLPFLNNFVAKIVY